MARDPSVDETRTRCGAKKGSGRNGQRGYCQQPAGYGTDHLGVGPCHYHMGSTPTIAEKYKKFKVTKEAQTILAKLDVEPVEDPLTELALIAGQVVAWKNAMAARVNKLTELRFTDEKYSEQLRSEVVLYERALDRCDKVLVNMAKLDIDGRLASIGERQAEIIMQALLVTLRELDVPEDVRKEARKRVGGHLRAIAAS